MPSSAYTPPEPSTPSLHDALPIYPARSGDIAAPTDRPTPVTPAAADRSSAVTTSMVYACRVGTSIWEILKRSRSTRMANSRFGMRRSEEHTSELQSLRHLVCRLLLIHPPNPPPLPYTTLFRSIRPGAVTSPRPPTGRHRSPRPPPIARPR